MAPKVSSTVFVTGSNGFIGSAVAKTFAQRGWTTYGLIRHERSASDLMRDEVTPIVGHAGGCDQFVPDLPAIDVIVTCDEDIPNYVVHHTARSAMIVQLCRHSRTLRGETDFKPLVIFTSGCKDYGTTLMHGDEGLTPHVETTPLSPPDLLRPRTEAATNMLSADHARDFDCVVTRPTTLYGRSGSYYSYFFGLAERAKQEWDGVLELPASPNAILHGTHVDDVAAAYFAIATARRQTVAGQVYNISASRYETLAEIVPVIEKSHGIRVTYRSPEAGDAETVGLYVLSLFSFPQWVGSEKIRRELGWEDVKSLFHEGYEVYRKAYEAAVASASGQVERVMAKKAASGTLQSSRG